jgi:nucleoside-diphosphate kinase
MVLAGDSAVEVVRVMNGATDARKADPGTVRGDLALSTSENLVHASDSAESAEREVDLWFPALA